MKLHNYFLLGVFLALVFSIALEAFSPDPMAVNFMLVVLGATSQYLMGLAALALIVLGGAELLERRGTRR